MSTEELLKPRYKVIADYPGNPFKEGSVLSKDQLDDKFQDGEQMTLTYPHLFKPLQWWEEREENDLPKYIRYSKTIYRVSSWDLDNGQLKCAWDRERILPMQPHCLPATESEYNEYLKQSKK